MENIWITYEYVSYEYVPYEYGKIHLKLVIIINKELKDISKPWKTASNFWWNLKYKTQLRAWIF